MPSPGIIAAVRDAREQQQSASALLQESAAQLTVKGLEFRV